MNAHQNLKRMDFDTLVRRTNRSINVLCVIVLLQAAFLTVSLYWRTNTDRHLVNLAKQVERDAGLTKTLAEKVDAQRYIVLSANDILKKVKR